MGFYVTDGQGHLLMMKRSANSKHLPGVWAPPGGHLELGENFFDCAKRELKEETNLDMQGVKIVGAVNNIFSPDNHYVNVDVWVYGVKGEVKNMEPDKCDKIEWLKLDNLPKEIMLTIPNLFKAYPNLPEEFKKLNSFENEAR